MAAYKEARGCYQMHNDGLFAIVPLCHARVIGQCHDSIKPVQCAFKQGTYQVGYSLQEKMLSTKHIYLPAA